MTDLYRVIPMDEVKAAMKRAADNAGEIDAEWMNAPLGPYQDAAEARAARVADVEAIVRAYTDDVSHHEVTERNIAIAEAARQSAWPSTIAEPGDPPYCHTCGSTRVVFRGAVEGWYCLACGASDDDE